MTVHRPPASTPDLADLARACEDARRALGRALARAASPEDRSGALADLDEALEAVARAKEALTRAERDAAGAP